MAQAHNTTTAAPSSADNPEKPPQPPQYRERHQAAYASGADAFLRGVRERKLQPLVLQPGQVLWLGQRDVPRVYQAAEAAEYEVCVEGVAFDFFPRQDPGRRKFYTKQNFMDLHREPDDCGLLVAKMPILLVTRGTDPGGKYAFGIEQIRQARINVGPAYHPMFGGDVEDPEGLCRHMLANACFTLGRKKHRVYGGSRFAAVYPDEVAVDARFWGPPGTQEKDVPIEQLKPSGEVYIIPREEWRELLNEERQFIRERGKALTGQKRIEMRDARKAIRDARQGRLITVPALPQGETLDLITPAPKEGLQEISFEGMNITVRKLPQGDFRLVFIRDGRRAISWIRDARFGRIQVGALLPMTAQVAMGLVSIEGAMEVAPEMSTGFEEAAIIALEERDGGFAADKAAVEAEAIPAGPEDFPETTKAVLSPEEESALEPMEISIGESPLAATLDKVAEGPAPAKAAKAKEPKASKAKAAKAKEPKASKAKAAKAKVEEPEILDPIEEEAQADPVGLVLRIIARQFTHIALDETRGLVGVGPEQQVAGDMVSIAEEHDQARLIVEMAIEQNPQLLTCCKHAAGTD